MTDLNTYTGAVFSPSKTYRYALWRKWDLRGKCIMFIGINPSRGGEFFNDPTIWRVIALAKEWGYGGLYFANLFAYRSPKIGSVIMAQTEGRAVGASTNPWLRIMGELSDKVVFAWGTWPDMPFLQERVNEVAAMFPKAQCMGFNLDGSPKHPLLIKNPVQLYDYSFQSPKRRLYTLLVSFHSNEKKRGKKDKGRDQDNNQPAKL